MCTVDGQWGSWEAWQCSVTCGTGTDTRTRNCDNPAPSNGGNNCVGSSTESTSCTEPDCPGTGYLDFLLRYQLIIVLLTKGRHFKHNLYLLYRALPNKTYTKRQITQIYTLTGDMCFTIESRQKQLQL